ncbi:MAG: hypothetical protein JWO42_3346, partial [Chloroflexi bacterium]|nr:hypothetical protein [Chloroflexota bacterium]
MVYMRQVGARVKRKEDPRLITGRSTYVDDLRLSDIGHVAIVRSTQAHARITAIDTTAAEALPGVIAVVSDAGYLSLVEPMPHGGEGGGIPAGMAPIATPILATDYVRHVGQAIAVVVAKDPYIAQDAVDLIDVSYEPLPAVVGVVAAIAPGAPQLYDSVPNNTAFTWVRKHGDSDAAFAGADVT